MQKAASNSNIRICLFNFGNKSLMLFFIIQAAPSVQTFTQFFHYNISSSKNFAIVLYISAPVDELEVLGKKEDFPVWNHFQ